jgi:flagellar biosynthesis protein FlhG
MRFSRERRSRPFMNEALKPHKIIWAVGGGKGGTGKSFLSASLALAFCERVGDVVALDADLGGPNLHTLLGSPAGGMDLGDFLAGRVSRLEDAAESTAYPGLRLIRGSDHSLFLANLAHAKKLKLIRQIKALPASGVVIDLGTGSAFNTLDLFVIAQPGILVVTPEPTAVENTYLFLRSCIVRVLKLYAQYLKLEDLARRLTQEIEGDARALRDFLFKLASSPGPESRALLAALRNFKPALIVNKARTDKDFLLGRSIADVAGKFFFINLQVLGTIPYDERVDGSLQRRAPFAREYPHSLAAQAIATAASTLLAATPETRPATTAAVIM